MISKVVSLKRNQGFMVFALVVVLFLSVSSSVCLYLFLSKNAIKNENDTISNLYEEKLKQLNEGKERLSSNLPILSTDINNKTNGINNLKDKEIELNKQLEGAISEAKNRGNKLKSTSLETSAEKLTPDSIVERKEVQKVIESDKKNADIIKNAKASGFDEKTLKNNAIRLNDELKTFLSNKENEALNNPNFKATYGREWVAIVNDLKIKGQKSVFNDLIIKQISELPKTKEGMESLKNLLLNTDKKKLNYYFAFDYFPHHKAKLEGFINDLKIEMVAMPELNANKNKITLSSKQDEFKRYVKNYEEFLKNLNSDDSDPKKDMAIIDEIRKHFLWYDKAFLELIKKNNK